MTRKEKTIFVLLTHKPWWLSTVIAIIVYGLLAYVLPLFEFQNPTGKGFAHGLTLLAPVFAILFLIPAGISAWRAWLKRKTR
jgi:hypothetical protein